MYQDKINYFRPNWGAKEIDLPDCPLDKIYNPSKKNPPALKNWTGLHCD